MTKLASLEKISEIKTHPNADSLEIARVLNYDCIVKKGEYHTNDSIVFIQPDTVLPDQPWATFYKAKSNRVKAIKLRGVWSEGIVEKMAIIPTSSENNDFEGIKHPIGYELSEILGITKYEAPEPQDLQAKGGLPFGLPITDEERYQNIIPLPYGEIVNVTLKRDGKSWTAYAAKNPDGEWVYGVCGRKLEYKLEASNDYTKFQGIAVDLRNFCVRNNVALALRGEITGAGIQANKGNPHAVGEKKLSIFSTYLIDERKYAGMDNSLYYEFLAPTIGFTPIERLEDSVLLTPELIKKYAEDLTEVNGLPFEGVVIKGKNFSFKVINKHYDSKK